jgi:hypothetical protein
VGSSPKRPDKSIYLIEPHAVERDLILSPPFFLFSPPAAPEQHGGQDDQGEQGGSRRAARTERARACCPARTVAGSSGSPRPRQARARRPSSRRTGGSRPGRERRGPARPDPRRRRGRHGQPARRQAKPSHPPYSSHPSTNAEAQRREYGASYSIPVGLPAGLELRPRTVPASWPQPSPEGSASRLGRATGGRRIEAPEPGFLTRVRARNLKGETGTWERHACATHGGPT